MMLGAGPKGPERFGASLKQKEDTMKLISRFKAASLETPVLHGLLAEAQRAFAAASRGSQERRDALETIRNIEWRPARHVSNVHRGWSSGRPRVVCRRRHRSGRCEPDPLPLPLSRLEAMFERSAESYG
jgi:hypothetical protein